MTLPSVPPPSDAAPANPSRRRLLLSASMIAAAGSLLPWAQMAYAQAPAQASAAELQDFLRLSELLTMRSKLDQDVATRVYVALSAGDRGFAAELQALRAALAKAGVDDMRKFKDSPVEHDPAQKALAVRIVSAWYLGYTGTPGSLTTQDDTRFVTYTEALMFAPTRDVTVIPTYSRAGTDYWSAPPASIARD